MEIRTYRIEVPYDPGSAARNPEEPVMTARGKAVRKERPAAKSAKKKKQGVSRSITMRGYAAFFLTACVVTMLFLGEYLMLQSSVRRHTRIISGLRTELAGRRRENDDLEESIDSAVNLSEIYNCAVREMGLVPAKASQILFFDRENQEYVLQQEDLPRF